MTPSCLVHVSQPQIACNNGAIGSLSELLLLKPVFSGIWPKGGGTLAEGTQAGDTVPDHEGLAACMCPLEVPVL